MTRDLRSGIDAGTSVIKSVAFSLAGEQVAVAARPNVYQTLGGGQVEQDMGRTWADCAATLRELVERVPNSVEPRCGSRRDRPGRRVVAHRRGGRTGRRRPSLARFPARPAWCRTI